MPSNNKDRHQFAIFYPSGIPQYEENDTMHAFHIIDQEIMHRMIHVLRMEEGDNCILFDAIYAATVVIQGIEKKSIIVAIVEQKSHKKLLPAITLFLPLLKKAALEEAIYGAVEVGVSAIQLLITERSIQKFDMNFERTRLERVIIAAVEQRKQFDIPKLYNPQPLSSVLAEKKSAFTLIFFDPLGKNISEMVMQPQLNYSFLVGPENGFSPAESLLIQNYGVRYRLTPTILRSPTAATVATALLRTLTSHKD